MAFLPEGEMLITDRSGKMYRVNQRGQKMPMEGVPSVVAEGQGGLLDVVLHPEFEQNNSIYISYSLGKNTDKGNIATTAIAKATLNGNKLINVENIFIAEPYSTTKHHYGCRMLFDKDGYLFFSVGERGNEKENPQDLSRDLGKIHRIKDDGSIPTDNPFVDTPGARLSIYSYGHRNPQGITVHPVTGAGFKNVRCDLIFKFIPFNVLDAG
jgi:glucose/arabinose dehydrogenase